NGRGLHLKRSYGSPYNRLKIEMTVADVNGDDSVRLERPEVQSERFSGQEMRRNGIAVERVQHEDVERLKWLMLHRNSRVSGLSGISCVERVDGGLFFFLPSMDDACGRCGKVGSRTGAVLRRAGLSVAPRFLWECLTSLTVSPVPVPAASHRACRFPALGVPGHLTPRVMRRIESGTAVTPGTARGNRYTSPTCCRTSADATVASRGRGASCCPLDASAPSSRPSRGYRKSTDSHGPPGSSSPSLAAWD